MPRERCPSWTCSEWWAQCSSRLTAGSGQRRVWKPCKTALPKELGWESMVLPNVLIHRGAAGGVKRVPLGTRRRLGPEWGKKARMEWAPGVIRGRRYQRECCFPFSLRAHLCYSECCLGWWEQLAEQGPQSPLLGGVSHFQITTVVVLLSTGAQWYGLLDAAGIKASRKCLETLCILLIRWFVLSLGSGTGPGKGWELATKHSS